MAEMQNRLSEWMRGRRAVLRGGMSAAKRVVGLGLVAAACILAASALVNGWLTSSQWEALGTWVAGGGALVISWFVYDLNRRMHAIETKRADREEEQARRDRVNEWLSSRPALAFERVGFSLEDGLSFEIRNIGGAMAPGLHVYIEVWFPEPKLRFHRPVPSDWSGGSVDPQESVRFETGDMLKNFAITTRGDDWWHHVGITARTSDGDAEAWLMPVNERRWAPVPWGLYPDRYGRIGARPAGPKPWETVRERD